MLLASAQEEIVLDSISEIQNGADGVELTMKRPLLFDDSFSVKELNLIDQSIFNQPLIPDFSQNLKFKKQGSSSGFTIETFSGRGFGISPFLTTGRIFNQAIYQLNDHFSFGGSSFGAQSIYDQPKINQAIQNISTKGASMFIQYKVSDKFKVETRVSISNQRSPWEP